MGSSVIPLEVANPLAGLFEVAGHHAGVPVRLVPLPLAEWRLGHERSDAGLVRVIVEAHRLLLEQCDLLAGASELGLGVPQAALDPASRHGPLSLRSP